MDFIFEYEYIDLTTDELLRIFLNYLEESLTLAAKLEDLQIEMNVAYDEIRTRKAV